MKNLLRSQFVRENFFPKPQKIVSQINYPLLSAPCPPFSKDPKHLNELRKTAKKLVMNKLIKP